MGFVRLYKFLKNNRYDIVHNNIRTYFSHIALLLTQKKCHLIYQEHGDIHTSGEIFKSRLGYFLFSKMYSRFLTVSEDTRVIMKKAGVSLNRCENIDNPIALHEYDARTPKEIAKRAIGLAANSIIVGTACRLVKQKDLPLFLKTAKILNKAFPEIEYVIAGDGELKDKLKQLAKELDLEKVLHFLGIRNDMPVVYRAFDIFMLTSLQESFGKTIIECLASEIPIVATVPKIGGGKRIIEQSPGILFTHKRDPYELSLIASNLIVDSEKRKRIGREGRAWVLTQEKYHVDNWIKRLERIYKAMLVK